MNTVLEELFLGNIGPNERYYGNDKPFHEAMKRLTEYESKVSSFLTEEQNEVFTKFTHTQLEINALTASEKFVYGFRLGARIMLEVLDGDSLE